MLSSMKIKARSSNTGLVPQEEGATAEKLHRHIVHVLRSRRYQDFHNSLPAPPIAFGAEERSVKDPADSDEKLRNKLEANRKEAMTESQVVADFLDKAMLLKAKTPGLHAGEISDNDEESSGDDAIDDDDCSVHSRFDADEDNENSDY